MALDESLDAINAKLAAAAGYMERIDKAASSVAGSSSKVNRNLKDVGSGAPHTSHSGYGVGEATFGGAKSGEPLLAETLLLMVLARSTRLARALLTEIVLPLKEDRAAAVVRRRQWGLVDSGILPTV